MSILLSTSWENQLKDELHQDYFINLMKQVDIEYDNAICFPPKELLFKALNSCDFENVKVVIIGQDPYHGEGEANGLSFSVNDGVKIPPSLRNIFREVASDLNQIFMPTTGNLAHWAKQGVLMLNASLSVQKDKPNSHKHLKWNLFTDAIINILSERKDGIVFLLWGNFAHQKGIKIDTTKHLILKSGHPSPMSANQGKWFGNTHFSQTNNYLLKIGKQPICWFIEQ